MKKYFLLIAIASTWMACKENKDFDASGNFEADEVIVSAQQNGALLNYSVEEGMQLKDGENVGQIDVKNIELQKEQAEAKISALEQKTMNPNDQIQLIKKQLSVQEAQLQQMNRERIRTENLVREDAATQKQLDDMNAAIDQLQKQIAVTRQQIQLSTYNIQTQNRSILSEKAPIEKSIRQIQDLIQKGEIINPINGTVLVNYALKGEWQMMGKPLYKIANLDTLQLKAYITGTQLAQIQLGQKVNVRIDEGEKNYKEYSGKIIWISDKSEFSPKNIPTKDERANLVYAIKIQVPNDGFLKIGMYGEVLF